MTRGSRMHCIAAASTVDESPCLAEGSAHEQRYDFDTSVRWYVVQSTADRNVTSPNRQIFEPSIDEVVESSDHQTIVLLKR